MRQWDIHLPCPQTPLSHVVLDYRVPAGEPVLVPEPLEDALYRVPLLLRKAAVILQDPVDHAPVRVQLGPARRRSSTIPGRNRVLQHLAHRVPVQSEHPRRLPSAHTIHHAGPAHPRVHLHLVHPSHLPSSCPQLYGRRRAVRYYSATSLRRHPPARSIITPPFTTFVKEIELLPDNAVVRYTVPLPDDSFIPEGKAQEIPMNGSVVSTVDVSPPNWTK